MELSPAAQTRRERLRASRSFRPVLALIGVAFWFMALAPDERWARGVQLLIVAMTAGVALWTSFTGERLRIRLLIVLGAALFAAVQLVTDEPALATGAGVLSGLLVLGIIVVIGRGIVGEGEVNRQSVVGAICVYVLLGMLFSFIYSVIALQGSDAFFSQHTDGTPAVRLYFSFTTLSTVGYGDYSAAGDLGHALSVTEALLGQLYLVTVVAVLVSRIAPSQRRWQG